MDINVTDDEITKDQANKNLDYAYQTNVNILIGKLKDHLVLALLEPDPNKRERAMKKVLAVIAKNRTPIRPGRKFERKTPRKKRFYMNKKSAL